MASRSVNKIGAELALCPAPFSEWRSGDEFREQIGIDIAA
jgi:hypothetical protein